MGTAVKMRALLDGQNAFYLQPDYIEKTKRDFAQVEPLPASYQWDTDYTIVRIAKQVFSIVVFPIAIYNTLHAVAACVGILPSSYPALFMPWTADQLRPKIDLMNQWKYKRLTISVDGYQIDALMTGKISTLNNGKWFVVANGNGTFYEAMTFDDNFKELITATRANALFFNYNGVGASNGWPNRYVMAKAHRAMLAFLADQENGIGAKEIIGYGHSIGGGNQGDALYGHELAKDVKYVFIKSRTFSDLSMIVTDLTHRILGILVWVLGWNMSSIESSRQLAAPEIIMQTAAVAHYEELIDSAKIIDDGIITAKASLGKAVLDDPSIPKKNKIVIGVPERHNDPLSNIPFLAQKIDELLRQG